MIVVLIGCHGILRNCIFSAHDLLGLLKGRLLLLCKGTILVVIHFIDLVVVDFIATTLLDLLLRLLVRFLLRIFLATIGLIVYEFSTIRKLRL